MSCGHDPRQEAQERSQAVREKMAQVKHKIIVLSGKGGVGKSTVAVSLATSLALEGKRVGLLDVDLHGPTVPQLLGLQGRQLELVDSMLLPMEVGDNLKVMSIGFLLGDTDEAVVWRGPMKAVAIEQFLGEVEWGELDYLVIDSPPGTGDEPLAVCQAIGTMDGAVIVTTPQETALSNVRRSIKFCELLNLKVLGVVENMAGFVCPNCGEVTHVFSKGGGATMAAKAGVPLLASVPLDPAIVQAADAGRSFVYHYSESTAAKEFARAIGPILALEGDTPTEVERPATETSRETVQATSPEVAVPQAVLRFAIPTGNGLLFPHFGHCPEFTLVDVDPHTKEVIGSTTIPAPEHEPGLLPRWLAEKGAQFVIAGGMGTQAQQLFDDQGITVIVGAEVAEPETVVRKFLAGDLETGHNTCDH
jgi:Mrp family chromosome partitioning ATPase/predicted Fe-Mo cluster-binding NifX family protein